MTFAVYIKNPVTGRHYRRSIWFSDPARAEQARVGWLDSCPNCEALTVERH